MRTDGSNLKEMRPSVAIPGSRVFSQSAVTGSGRKAAVSVVLPGTSVVRFPLLPFYFVEELVLVDGKNLLQLTNFGRSDTTKGNGGTLAGQRVFFYASANPFGSNPGENCQIFSVNALGGNLHS